MKVAFSDVGIPLGCPLAAMAFFEAHPYVHQAMAAAGLAFISAVISQGVKLVFHLLSRKKS